MFNNRQRYTLTSPLGTLKLKADPMGWSDTETEIGRSEKTFGIFLTISNNLQFIKEGKDFIELNYKVYGVNAEVKLTKEVKHPLTDEWSLAFTGFLDFTTRSLEDNKLKIDFIEGGLREVLASQMKENFELDRTETIDGTVIPNLEPDELTLKGREIYLLSKLDNEENDAFYVKSGTWRSGADYREVFQPFPMEVVANSDRENISTPLESNGDIANPEGAQSMFYLIADRDRGEIKIKQNASFRIAPMYKSGVQNDPTTYSQGANASNVSIDIVLKRYTGGNLYTVAEETVLQSVAFINVVDPDDIAFGTTHTINYETSIFPKTDESYAIGIKMRGRYGSTTDGFFNMLLDQYSGTLQLAEDSFFERTNTKFMRLFDVGKRLTEIYTGLPKFNSDLLNSTEWKDLGLSCGGWIRNLRVKTEDDQLIDWSLTINWEDFYKSVNAILPVGYGIANIGAAQRIVFEKIRYFFQPYVTIKIGQVSKVKRSTAAEFVYSSINTGYTKGGKYEAPLGLDEPNIEANYITPVTITENKYEVLGTSRTDTYEIEQIRRKQYEDFPDEDTNSDKDNFLIDAKYLTRSNFKNYFEVREWSEDFEAEPRGVYSPSTGYNYRLSPANNRNRHATWFNAALVKMQDKKIRFASSEGNSQLVTKLIGKPEIKENADILISELANPMFEPEWIECEYPFTQELLDTFQGTHIKDQQEINNYYGLIEFINERNEKERGYLFTAKVKDKFSLKILKSYGF